MSSIILNSTHIIDKINNSTFQIDFERSIMLQDKNIALTSASLYFSWRNITSYNNTFSYIWINDIEYCVELPIGFYDQPGSCPEALEFGCATKLRLGRFKGFTLFIAWVPPKSERPSSASYFAGCDATSRRAAPPKVHPKILSSRFAFLKEHKEKARAPRTKLGT